MAPHIVHEPFHARALPHAPPAAETAAGHHSHAAIHVLLVEDDEDDYLITRDLLRQVPGAAFEVRWTRTVPEGLAALAGEAFDVVLLDYHLGAMTGLDFLGRMPLDDPSPPVILLTGHDDGAVDVAAMRMGAADYLAKGALNPTMLERSVRYAVERYRAQLARHDAEQRYQLLVDSVDAIVWQGDPETFQFTFVSRAAEHLLGYPVERWTGEPTFWADHMHPDDRAWAPAFCAEATRSGEPHSFEYRMLAADGRVVWLRDIVRSVRSGGTRVAAGVMVDVTAAKEAEAQLRLRDRALAAVGEGIVIGDPHQPDHPIVYVNPAFERLTGFPAGEVLGRNFRFLHGPGTDPAAVDEVRAGLRDGHPVTAELLNYRKDGTPFWNRLSITPIHGAGGELTHFVGVQRDVTEQRTAREALESSHALLNTIIEGTPDAVFAKDRDGRYLLINRAGAEFLGFTPDEVVGRTDAELVSAEAARVFGRSDTAVMRGGVPVVNEETAELPSGRRTYHALKSPLRGGGGEVAGVVGISRDITERKRSEEALRESNERFALVQRATHDVIWDWDLLDGSVRWNEEIVRTFGYPAGTATTSIEWWEERVHPEHLERVLDSLEVALEGDGAWLAEYPFRRADDSYAVVFDRGYILRDDAGSPVRMIGSMQDVTEHRRLVEALERSEARYRRLVESAPQTIFALDAAGCFTEINPAGLALLQRAPGELLGHPYAGVVAPDDLPGAGALFLSLLSGAETAVETTLRVCRPSGEERWVRVDAVGIRHAGEVSGAHGIARDITHERERESRMRLFAAALENLTESVNVLDDRGRILFANAAHARMLGHDPAGTGAVEAFASDEIRPVLDEVRARGVWRGLLQLRRQDGEPIAVDAHMERVEQEGHSLIFTISRDVGDELEREHRLRRAERLATIGTLVGGVAHELNNPLAAIVGFTQLLLMDERSAAEREDLETIRREAERMAEIVANLRLLARDTQEARPGREAVDVADVVRHVLRTRAYALRTHNVRVSEEIDPELPAVMGDRSQLEQVVLNLVVNAEQAMAGHDRPGVLVVGARPSGSGVALHVSDNGPGIAPGHLQRIFDPFFTTKGPGEGTGLGLSLVHNLVAEHGGEVHVESRPGAGATFRVDLPATARAVAAPRGREAGPPSAPRRILVVDDETPVRRVIARSLARRGHRVDEAAEGGEALGLVEAARGAGDGYDLIISDLRMPGLDGMQLLARLRQRGEDMAERLVFLTGDTADEACQRIRSEARIPVLTKPIDMTELARVVETATA